MTATLDGGVHSAATTVQVSVAGGTATAGTDFGAVPGFTITIPANAASGAETFTLIPVDRQPGRRAGRDGDGPRDGHGTDREPATDDRDNDDTPQATLVLTPASIPENGGRSMVTAILDGASARRR